MDLVEYGQENPRVAVLLHGGGLSWWSCREAALRLEDRLHVVLPVLDGHAGSGHSFTSMEENAARLIDLIDRRFGGQVDLLAGLSLGGQIVVEMLSRRPDICRHALIESALVKPMKLTHAMIRPAFGMSWGLVKQRWFAKLQFAWLGLPENLFEEYFRDTCRITKEDMIAFLEANSAYAIKPSLSQTRARVKIVAGSREEPSILASARLLHQAIPGSELQILKGLRHGQLSICQPDRYAAMVLTFLAEETDPGEP